MLFKFFFIENYNGALKNTQLDRCILHKEIWRDITKTEDIESQLSVCPTIKHALEIIHDIKDNNSPRHVNVLFTGSLHLIGSTLGLLNSSDSMMKTAAKAKRIRT
jgi:hypothetical protein